MLTQSQLNENLIEFAKIGDLNKIKLVLEQALSFMHLMIMY
jgi:hypothetical protein